MTTPRPAILSIQSHVAFGHVGNSAAVLPLQRLGFEVIALNTVALAHHPGYGSFTGQVAEAALLHEMLDRLDRVGALDACVGVLSGYLGTAAIGEVVEDAVARVRVRRPDAVYCCDPVIGDEDTGVFVREGIAEVFAERLLPEADLATPNVFELALLGGARIRSTEDALAAATVLLDRGTRVVVGTGLPAPDRPGRIGMMAAERSAAWLVTTPRRDVVLHGTGDVFSALFLSHFLRADRRVPLALERTAGAIFALVERTIAEGGAELALVAAQDLFASPDPGEGARRLR